VKNIAQTNNGISIMCTPILRMFKVVTIKLIAPNNDEILVRCNANIAKSTDGPECALIDDSGGYTVHPVPAPDSIKIEPIIHTNAGGKHQKLILFNLANAISTAPIIIGKKKFPLEMDVKVTFKPLKEPYVQVTLHTAHPSIIRTNLINYFLITLFRSYGFYSHDASLYDIMSVLKLDCLICSVHHLWQ